MNTIKSICFQEKSHDFNINYSYGIEIKELKELEKIDILLFSFEAIQCYSYSLRFLFFSGINYLWVIYCVLVGFLLL